MQTKKFYVVVIAPYEGFRIGDRLSVHAYKVDAQRAIDESGLNDWIVQHLEIFEG